MSTYRTGNHWGVTIVREGTCPASTKGLCVSMLEGFATCDENECVHHPSGQRGSQLVAVVVNGDQELAERICTLLNGRNDLQTAQDALVANRNLWQRRALDAGWKP